MSGKCTDFRYFCYLWKQMAATTDILSNVLWASWIGLQALKVFARPKLTSILLRTYARQGEMAQKPGPQNSLDIYPETTRNSLDIYPETSWMLSRDPIRFVSESVSADIGQIWNHSELEWCSILTALDPQMKNIETISNLSMPEMVLSWIAYERLRWPGARWPGCTPA